MTYGTPCHAIGHFVFWCHHVTYRTPCHVSGHLVIYSECCRFESIFYSQAFFTLHSFLLVLRLPWELALQPQGQQGFMLIFETQPRPNYLFESHQSTKDVQRQVLFKGYSCLANEKSASYGIQTLFTIGEHVRSLMLYPFHHRAMWFELN